MRPIGTNGKPMSDKAYKNLINIAARMSLKRVGKSHSA